MNILNKNTSTNRGYTLLFAVIVTVVVLSIATFILSISRKEFILSSGARDSTTAIYAADSGIECAIENQSSLATSSGAGYITNCTVAGGNWLILRTYSTVDAKVVISTSTFYLPVYSGSGAAPLGSPCVAVSVGQWITLAGSMITNIESRGYNVGWNPPSPNGTGSLTGDCSAPGARKLERAIRRVQST